MLAPTSATEQQRLQTAPVEDDDEEHEQPEQSHPVLGKRRQPLFQKNETGRTQRRACQSAHASRSSARG